MATYDIKTITLPNGDVCNLKASGGAGLPIGTIQMYGGTTAPTDWLVCDGSAVSRATYSDLFAVIGTNFGAGDGTTTFNLPDFRGRTAVGVGTGTASGATAHPITGTGSSGGNEDGVVINHTHDVSSSGQHSHTVQLRLRASANVAQGDKFQTTTNLSSGTWTSSHARADSGGDGGAHTHTTDNPANGTSATGANMMPFRAVNFIIYAGA